MKLLKTKIVIQAINNARDLNSQGLLPKKLHDITKSDFWKSPPKTSIDKKNQILQLAKTNKPKPIKPSKLYLAFIRYISKSNKSSYDPIFTKQIKELAPNWFKK